MVTKGFKSTIPAVGLRNRREHNRMFLDGERGEGKGRGLFGPGDRLQGTRGEEEDRRTGGQ